MLGGGCLVMCGGGCRVVCGGCRSDFEVCEGDSCIRMLMVGCGGGVAG